jgi:hypothetical protein
MFDFYFKKISLKYAFSNNFIDLKTLAHPAEILLEVHLKDI